MAGRLKKFFNFFSVSFPEEYTMTPINMNMGDQEIMVGLKEVKGDIIKYRKWLDTHITKAYPEEKLVFWCFLKLWEMELEKEKLEAEADVLELKPTEFHANLTLVPEDPKNPDESHVQIKSVQEVNVVKITPEAVTIEPLEPTPLQPKKRCINVETEEGIVTYEVLPDGSLVLAEDGI